ncbi:FAD-dependent oxidoreductase [Christensenellaceae bacterium OttesenSCG-928-M15]|nr:FAD-dependent oxidoreductase [Christensenellaceae bacterium OttesenSCG-928-M15]
MKKSISLFLIVCLMGAFLFGCTSQPASTPEETAAPTPSAAPAGIYTPGVYQANATGFGGEIKLSVTVDDHNITTITVLENAETAGIGSNAIEQLPEKFVAENGAEVDAIAGATITSTAMKEAVQSALNQAMGKEAGTDTAMNDGVYSASVVSYSETNGLPDGNGGLEINTTISGNAITNIEVVRYSDTGVIGGMAFPMLAASVISTQSLGVDAVSGATASSNAFLSAVSDCVKQAGGDPAALKARTVEKRAAETAQHTADILVIGAGISGLTAAVQAARDGASVILLEKNEVLSSSTTRSLGFVVGADTDMQKKQDINDTWEALYQDMLACYEDEAELDKALLEKACRDSKELIPFLEESGVMFEYVKNVSPMEPRATMRTHVTQGGGSALSSALLETAESLGVTVLFGTPATELLMADGAVTGSKASNKYGDDITINAQAVIMCAGSYSNNPEMFKKLNPKLTNVEYLCGSGEGDAYNLSVAINADIVDIPYPQMMYYFFSPTWATCPAVLPGSPDNNVPDHLRVDGGGKRVASEQDFCFEYIKKNWDAGYTEGYCVVGQAFADKYPETVETALTTTVSVSGLPFGYQSDSIAELAENVGIDPDVLTATVDRYNALCDKGTDDDFHKDAEHMVKIEAPYYIIRLPEIATDGYTGVRINEHAQVLDTNGGIIKGYYAAGSCAVGQMTGVNYFGCGSSLLIGGVYGREAASHAAAAIKAA